MEPIDDAPEILDTMLGYLGFATRISVDRSNQTLHVGSGDGPYLIGPGGERLAAITHLLNRLLLERHPGAHHVQVDIDGYLATRDHRMLEEADAVAARVLATGRTLKLEPMNSYQRRLIHTHFQNHPGVRTWSPADASKLKRISISPRNPGG